MSKEIIDKGQIFTVSINGEDYIADVKSDGNVQVNVNGKVYIATVSAGGEVSNIVENMAEKIQGETISAPLAGDICKVCVVSGESVSAGKVLLILEAMKMETEIKAPRDLLVGDINVKEGESVSAGDALLTI